MDELPEKVNAEHARTLISTERAQVVDLRNEEEFAEAHVAGAERVGDPETIGEHISKDRPVIVVCNDGDSSAETASRLRGDGYRAASIEGGMEAWAGDRLPVQPGVDEEFEGPKKTALY
jgi:rhodanese-related sulfurtransferase